MDVGQRLRCQTSDDGEEKQPQPRRQQHRWLLPRGGAREQRHSQRKIECLVFAVSIGISVWRLCLGVGITAASASSLRQLTGIATSRAPWSWVFDPERWVPVYEIQFMDIRMLEDLEIALQCMHRAAQSIRASNVAYVGNFSGSQLSHPAYHHESWQKYILEAERKPQPVKVNKVKRG